MNWREYQKQWRGNPQGRLCACGKPAVTNRQGSDLCAVCAERGSITRRRAATKKYCGELREQSAGTGQSVEDFYAVRRGEENPICGASLALLEAQLNKLAA